MTLYICYAKAGREIEVKDAMNDLGIVAKVPRKVDLIRQGKQRWPEAVTTAYLLNYVFADMDGDQWHQAKSIKHLASTMLAVPHGERKHVDKFCDAVEADYTQRMAQIELGERVAQYQPDDMLEIMAGPFAGRIMRFRQIVEDATGLFPRVKGEVDGIFGRSAMVDADVLDVRAAE